MDILTQSRLIVGCGNPGERYLHSRHNVGFQFLDHLAKKISIPLNIDKKKAIYGISAKESNDKVILLKPQTFVGLSGEAVLYLSAFFKVSVENIAIIYDDINVDFGKIVCNNPNAIHSGVANIKDEIKSPEFTSYGIGIGPLPPRIKLDNFYLDSFSIEEKKEIPSIFAKLTTSVKKFIGKKYLKN